MLKQLRILDETVANTHFCEVVFLSLSLFVPPNCFI